MSHPDQGALFRQADPETSRSAAQSINSAGLEELILTVFAEHPALTDDELADLLPTYYPPTIKTARSRLHRAGCVQDSGERRTSHRGRAMIVWVVTP